MEKSTVDGRLKKKKGKEEEEKEEEVLGRRLCLRAARVPSLPAGRPRAVVALAARAARGSLARPSRKVTGATRLSSTVVRS
ncbi:hypothetical protein GW17_00048055 [Ensete ventricosum]|nr:hypothetical protein GW17_00048055 [Ensete ventricosum]